MLNNLIIIVTLIWYLVLQFPYYYNIGMRMLNNVMRCMPMLHNGLEFD